MNRIILACWLVFLLTCSAAAQQILPVVWEEDPGAFSTRFRTAPERWFFQRTKSTETAVSAALDAEALYLDIYCAESDRDNLKNALALANDRLEVRLFPGDAGGMDFLPECRFRIETGTGKVLQYTSLVPDRDFVSPVFRASVSRRGGGCFVHIELPWFFFSDRLPRPGSLWRLAVSRNYTPVFGSAGESAVRAGYLRFPALTPEQEKAFLGSILRCAWTDRMKERAAAVPKMYYSVAGGRRKLGFLYPGQDWRDAQLSILRIPDDPTMKKIGSGMADFSGLPIEKARAFYLKNAPELMDEGVRCRTERREKLLDGLFGENEKTREKLK